MNVSAPRAAGILLAVLCLLQLLCLWRAPTVYSPATIHVRLKPGQAIELGRAELAAPQAAASHLGIRRDQAGRWTIRNTSVGRRVLLERAGVDHAMGALALTGGHSFRVGAAGFLVEASDGRRMAFHGAGHAWRYDGATLLRDGAALPACPGASMSSRFAGWWNRAMPHALTTDRALLFGGNLDCGNRIGIAHTAGRSAVVTRDGAALMLSNAVGAEAHSPLMIATALGAADLAQREEALDTVTALTAGRTRIAVSIDADQLTLKPLRRIALFTDTTTTLPDAVRWTWQQRGAWALPSGGAWLVMLGLCIMLGASGALAFARGRWPFVRGAAPVLALAASASALIAIAGVGALLLQRSGAPLGIGISMLLGWAALWCFLVAAGRASLASCAGVLLLGAGLLMQLDMGLGAMESSWLRHIQKTTALLAIGLGAGAHLRLRLRAGALHMPQTTLECVLAFMAAAALLALVLQVLVGDETGVFDLQPVEFAKLALTALTAHCLAIGLGWNRAMARQESNVVRWLRLAGPVLLFAALAALALLQVDDYSPLMLLLVWAMAMALAYSIAARQKVMGATLLGAGAVAVAAVAWLRLAGGPEAAQWGFYADRFAVWLDPASHPHTGQQLLLAARAIAQGAWWGADNWLGLGALGQSAGSALHIPAVQDDFAPTFFIYRHGLLGALALWCLQALFLGGLLLTAARSFAAAERTRDFRQAWLGRFRCFVLCGGAAFVLGHLLLSWGTNLAIFPIMGQPMSFLSAGGSHLLFFICPLLAFDAISAQSLEENPSCRSMSNTKSWAR